MRIIKSLFFVAATAVAPLSWSLSYDALRWMPYHKAWSGSAASGPCHWQPVQVRQYRAPAYLGLSTHLTYRRPDSNSSTRGIILKPVVALA